MFRHRTILHRQHFRNRLLPASRRGNILLLATACIVLILAFAAFSIDIGYITLTKAQLQNAVDSAALAAAMDLNPMGDQDDVIAAARQSAQDMALLHSAGDHDEVQIDPAKDVEFGRRIWDPQTGAYTTQWGPQATPYNIVRVSARRDTYTETNKKGKQNTVDNRLPLFFAPVIGNKKANLKVSAIATFQPRDMVLVLDYSASMNDDSELTAIPKLGKNAVVANIKQMWQELGSPVYGNMGFEPDWVTVPGRPKSGSIPHIDVTWKDTQVYVKSTSDLSNIVMEFSNGNRQKIEGLNSKTGTFKGTGSNNNRTITQVWVKSGSNASNDGPGYGEKFDFYDDDTIIKGLGLTNVPYPSQGSWKDYVRYARDQSWYLNEIDTYGYRRKFGALTLINYWNVNKPGHDETPNLWKVSQQPIAALKDAADLLLDYLQEVEAEDQVGFVSYTYTADNSGSKLEAALTRDYATIKTLSRKRQAGHYDQYTNIGAGMKKGRVELENNARPAAFRMMILMTDGVANKSPTSASPRNACIDEAYKAKDANIKIMTVSLGLGADTQLMQEIADITGGIHFNVPGGSGVEEYQEQLKLVFGEIASDRPLKLITVTETEEE